MLKALEPIPCVPLQGPQTTFGWWVLTGEFPREKRAGGLCRTVARITCQTAVPFRASTQWTARVLKKSDVVQQSISLSLSLSLPRLFNRPHCFAQILDRWSPRAVSSGFPDPLKALLRNQREESGLHQHHLEELTKPAHKTTPPKK